MTEATGPAPAGPGTAWRRAYIGLGTNQGELVATLQATIDTLRSIPSCRFVAASPLYRSAPLDAPGPDYVNAVVGVDTELDPYALLLALLDIELLFGRARRRPLGQRNAPRRIDLDLLLVGGLVVRSTPLVLPHPRMHARAFVLRPLHDLDPGLQVPGHGPVAGLLARVADQSIAALDQEAGDRR